MRQLGAGEFATVWLGHDDELDVPVAIKVLAANWAPNVDVRRRFVDEARVLRRIQGPWVVGVHDKGSLDDGRPSFVMNDADGRTVADLVANPQDQPTALATAVAVGGAGAARPPTCCTATSSRATCRGTAVGTGPSC